MISLLLIGFAPATFLLAFIYLRDLYEREPLSFVLSVYLRGMLLVIPATMFEIVLSFLLPSGAVTGSFIVTGLTEEACKYAGAMLIFYKSFEFNEEMDGVVYASALSLGFATLENMLYVLSRGAQVALLRGLMAVPGHALFAIVMGLYLGRAKFASGSKKVDYQVKALFIPAVLHGIYDYLLTSYAWLLVLIVPFTGYLWWTALSAMKEASDDSPFRRRGP